MVKAPDANSTATLRMSAPPRRTYEIDTVLIFTVTVRDQGPAIKDLCPERVPPCSIEHHALAAAQWATAVHS